LALRAECEGLCFYGQKIGGANLGSSNLIQSLRRQIFERVPTIKTDLCRVPGQALVAAGERGVHVIELVRRNKVIVSHGVIGQIGEELQQRRVLQAQRAGGAGIIAAVRVSKGIFCNER
jgi:hypothetical protein